MLNLNAMSVGEICLAYAEMNHNGISPDMPLADAVRHACAMRANQARSPKPIIGQTIYHNDQAYYVPQGMTLEQILGN